MRNHIDKMLGTLLLDAVFNAYWKEERKKILRWVFMPFVLHFLFANIYYLTQLMDDIDQDYGLFQDLCRLVADKGSCTAPASQEIIFRWLFFTTLCH